MLLIAAQLVCRAWSTPLTVCMCGVAAVLCCRTGIMEMAVTMVEARRRKQAAAAPSSSSSKSSVTAAVPAKQEAAV